MTRICAIHQPNFFPWLSYFEKIHRSDVFVFLDDVDYSKGNGRNWSSRVKVNINGVERWVGCNISRYSGTKKIREVVISDNQLWRKKMLRTLEINYRKSPYFASVIRILEPLVNNKMTNLAEFNILSVKELSDELGINYKTVRQSELAVEGSSNELLVNITRSVGCDAYLCGGGATDYMDDSIFRKASIDIIYQDFSQIFYKQIHSGKFIPGLSIIDTMMCVGLDRTLELLKSS